MVQPATGQEKKQAKVPMWNIGSMASMDSSGAGSCRRVRTVSTISVKAAMEVKKLRSDSMTALLRPVVPEVKASISRPSGSMLWGSRSVGSKAV